ncbi:hypothetical protein C8R44DRAFT_733848 [Mycena epipterygia]|nr:hypothetical protein C8R44DRAFT_733848 [Mycena epipterygia]
MERDSSAEAPLTSDSTSYDPDPSLIEGRMFNVTVAMYQGHGVEEVHYSRFSALCSQDGRSVADISQSACGFVIRILFSSMELRARAVFMLPSSTMVDDLIPFRDFMVLYEHSHFLTEYIYAYCAASDYVYSALYCELNQYRAGGTALTGFASQLAEFGQNLRQNSVEISALPSATAYHEGWGILKAVDEVMEDGWTRAAASWSAKWSYSEFWLGQANNIFIELQITSNFEVPCPTPNRFCIYVNFLKKLSGQKWISMLIYIHSRTPTDGIPIPLSREEFRNFSIIFQMARMSRLLVSPSIYLSGPGTWAQVPLFKEPTGLGSAGSVEIRWNLGIFVEPGLVDGFILGFQVLFF